MVCNNSFKTGKHCQRIPLLDPLPIDILILISEANEKHMD